MSAHVSHTQAEPAHQSFASLRHSGYRAFFLGSATAMLADSIEHVISYWVVFQKFRSPALGGVAVLSHWLPFLLFSVQAGALADRWDPRRLIQLGMLLFAFVSMAWAILFDTNSLQMWPAGALLVLHGVAGVLWNPPAQALVHDIVAPQQLPSAVRLTATARYLGLLMGPARGSGFRPAPPRPPNPYGKDRPPIGARICRDHRHDSGSSRQRADHDHDDPRRSGFILCGQLVSSADAGLCLRPRARRSRHVVQHAARGRCGRGFERWLRPGKPAAARPGSGHRPHSCGAVGLWAGELV